jgi:hypothetical protein
MPARAEPATPRYQHPDRSEPVSDIDQSGQPVWSPITKMVATIAGRSLAATFMAAALRIG